MSDLQKVDFNSIYYRQYAPLIKSHLAERSTKIHESKGVASSSIIMECMFEALLNAPKNPSWLMLYAKDLNGEISSLGNYLEVLYKLASGNKCKISVLIDQVPEHDAAIFNAYDLLNSFVVDPAYSEMVKMKILENTPRSQLRKELKEIISTMQGEQSKLNGIRPQDVEHTYFAISSANMFRLELDNESRKTYYCFNNSSYVDGLKILFERYFNQLPKAGQSDNAEVEEVRIPSF